MEFGHLLDYNQYITVVFKSQVFLRGFNPRTRVGYDRALLPRLWPHWFSRLPNIPLVIESR